MCWGFVWVSICLRGSFHWVFCVGGCGLFVFERAVVSWDFCLLGVWVVVISFVGVTKTRHLYMTRGHINRHTVMQKHAGMTRLPDTVCNGNTEMQKHAGRGLACTNFMRVYVLPSCSKSRSGSAMSSMSSSAPPRI